MQNYNNNSNLSDDHEHHPSTAYSSKPLPSSLMFDPALKKAVKQLKNAHNYYQAQVALNIIKIIVEHEIESTTRRKTELVQKTKAIQSNENWHKDHCDDRLWFDLSETLNAASKLLTETPTDLQSQVIPSVAYMIEKSLTASDETSEKNTAE
ncbi:MAG: hypothetical protein AAGI66_04155 [Cyanobacteria bacterium P01_H01_bin.74]